MDLTVLNDIQIQCGDTYTYEGRNVPRVTEIIHKMISEDYLLKWCNNLGFRHIPYKDYLDQASEYGSTTHSTIEAYLKKEPTPIDNKIRNSFYAFLEWWKKLIINNKVEILGQEQPLICKYFGGTYDLLIKINGKTYIVDFKTSNNVTYKYYLQLAAYKYMFENYYNTLIDGGVIILQLSKSNRTYNEYLINLSDPIQKEYLDFCEQTFLSLVHSYYHVLYMEERFNEISGKNSRIHDDGK